MFSHPTLTFGNRGRPAPSDIARRLVQVTGIDGSVAEQCVAANHNDYPTALASLVQAYGKGLLKPSHFTQIHRLHQNAKAINIELTALYREVHQLVEGLRDVSEVEAWSALRDNNWSHYCAIEAIRTQRVVALFNGRPPTQTSEALRPVAASTGAASVPLGSPATSPSVARGGIEPSGSTTSPQLCSNVANSKPKLTTGQPGRNLLSLSGLDPLIAMGTTVQLSLLLGDGADPLWKTTTASASPQPPSASPPERLPRKGEGARATASTDVCLAPFEGLVLSLLLTSTDVSVASEAGSEKDVHRRSKDWRRDVALTLCVAQALALPLAIRSERPFVQFSFPPGSSRPSWAYQLKYPAATMLTWERPVEANRFNAAMRAEMSDGGITQGREVELSEWTRVGRLVPNQGLRRNPAAVMMDAVRADLPDIFLIAASVLERQTGCGILVGPSLVRQGLLIPLLHSHNPARYLQHLQLADILEVTHSALTFSKLAGFPTFFEQACSIFHTRGLDLHRLFFDHRLQMTGSPSMASDFPSQSFLMALRYYHLEEDSTLVTHHFLCALQRSVDEGKAFRDVIGQQQKVEGTVRGIDPGFILRMVLENEFRSRPFADPNCQKDSRSVEVDKVPDRIRFLVEECGSIGFRREQILETWRCDVSAADPALALDDRSRLAEELKRICPLETAKYLLTFLDLEGTN